LKLCYACGPLFNCTVSEQSAWRSELKKLLGAEYVADPTDWDTVVDETLLTDAECSRMVERDLEAIDRCGALVYCSWKPSWGSPMELFYAHQQGKLTVTIMNGRIPAWVRWASDYVVSSVSEAARIVAEYFDLEAPCRR
jgi:hypothetical protein